MNPYRSIYRARPFLDAVDRLDFQLLAELCKDPLITHEALAHSIGRSSSSVRKRMHSLSERGILRGFSALPAPETLGLKGIGASWESPVPLEKIRALPGTVWTGDTVEGQSGTLGYVKDTQLWLQATKEIAGHPPSRTYPLAPYRGPPLGPLDLRTLHAMVRRPNGTVTELARLSGLSPKTISTRRVELIASGAVSVEPDIRGELSEAIVYHISVACGEGHLPIVQEVLQEAIPYGGIGSATCLICRATTLHEKAQRIAAVRKLGIECTEVTQHQNFEYNTPALLDMIEDALSGWKGSPESRLATRMKGHEGPTPYKEG